MRLHRPAVEVEKQPPPVESPPESPPTDNGPTDSPPADIAPIEDLHSEYPPESEAETAAQAAAVPETEVCYSKQFNVLSAM